jgi:uncharacterized protein with HEPN domain
MSRSGLEYLQHILDETEYLTDRGKGLNKDEFMRDETLKRAFVRSLEVIGEAAKQIPDDLRQKHGRVEWRAIAGMRDRLIHGYLFIMKALIRETVRAIRYPACSVGRSEARLPSPLAACGARWLNCAHSCQWRPSRCYCWLP